MSREPIPASALILRRASDDDRLFMARRARGMRFFGAVYAFVGGRVDDADRALGGDDQSTVLRSALVREMCEELGLDLRPGRREAVDPDWRRALIDGRVDWSAACDVADLAEVGDPVLRLITPAFYPRRFDTWFFLGTLGDRAMGALQPEELDDAGWDTAAGWLDRFDRGEVALAPPNVLTLRAIRGLPFDEWPDALTALQREIEGPAPQPIWNNPAVQLLALRTPTLPPAEHTNAYVIGRDPAYVIDPATPHQDEQRALELALRRAQRDGRRLRAVLLTHHHRDHVGAVSFVRRAFDLPVWAHAETAARVDFPVDRTLADGEHLDLGRGPDGRDGWALECIHTSGHAPGHLCYFEPRYGSLIAGDMVSTVSSVLVDPDDGDLDDYMASLERLTALDVRIVFPAHGPADARGTKVLTDQIEHRREREAAVLEAVLEGAATVEAVTRRVYVDVPERVLPLAARSVQSILGALERRGRVRVRGDDVVAV